MFNQPDFKLTSLLGLTIQRKPIPIDTVIPTNVEFTKSVHLNVSSVDDFKNFKNSISDGIQGVFEVILGKREFIDELLLPIYLNKSPDERKSIVLKEYERLLKVIEEVSLKADTPNRKPLYKEYFYSGQPVKKKSSHKKFTLIPEFKDEPLTKELEAFKEVLGEIRILDYSPAIDLLELSVEQFRMYLKFLPDEIKWARLLIERDELFAEIITHVDNVKFSIMNFVNLQERFNNNMQDKTTRKIKDLIWMVDRKTKTENIKVSINKSISKLNAFALEYNTSKSLRYNGKKLYTSFALLEQIFNSDYITFLLTTKSRYKFLLTEQIEKFSMDQPPLKKIKEQGRPFEIGMEE